MANKVVAVPGIGNVSFPDGMSDGDINSAIEQQLGANKPPDYSSMRPQDMAQQAMQQSGIKKFVSSPATPPNVNMQATPSAAGAGLNAFDELTRQVNSGQKAYRQDLNSILPGIANVAKQTLTAPSPEQGLGKALLGPLIQSGQDPNQSKAETAGLAMGVNSPAMKQAAQTGDYGGIVGHSILPLALALGGGRMASKDVARPFGNATETVLTPAEQTAKVAKIVTDTVNPPAKSMAGFEKNVAAQLPEVLQGKQITNRAELGQAFRESAAQAKSDYYKNIIEPNAQKIVDMPDGSTSTIGQLDKRLTEINATLRPQYEKGGMTAQAAITAQEKAAITSEAAQIRSTMNSELERQTGIPAENIGAMRQKFGQMGDVADKIQLALNKERYSANQAAKQPPNLEITATGAANKAIQTGYRWLKGHPADNALRDALSNSASSRQ